jgi:hypothetical protein
VVVIAEAPERELLELKYIVCALCPFTPTCCILFFAVLSSSAWGGHNRKLAFLVCTDQSMVGIPLWA